jgi:2-dehydropantoate 2-reductase
MSEPTQMPQASNAIGPNARVAVMGAGAVGSYFGGMLARAGADVTLIARPAHVEAIRAGGLFLDTVSFQERVAVEASSETSAARDADVILFCVKTIDTEATARSLAPYLAPGAIVVSLQNGVDNAARMRAAAGIDALPAVVYIAVAMPEPGHIKHLGRGELVVGELSGRSHASVPPESARTKRVASLFTSAGVPCGISADIEADLWSKFIRNCAGNAVTAIAKTTYARAAENPQSSELMGRVIAETVAVARASGVRLPDVDFAEVMRFFESMGEATSSTAQDLARGKRTEIDSLNGYVAELGKKLGVATPANFTLYALVKLLEEEIAKQRPA